MVLNPELSLKLLEPSVTMGKASVRAKVNIKWRYEKITENLQKIIENPNQTVPKAFISPWVVLVNEPINFFY